MKDELIRKRNVVLVYKDVKTIAGTRTSRPAIVVRVTQKVPLSRLTPEDRVPKTFEGMATDVLETEPIVALRKSVHRPMPGGVSGGHPEVTVGTINPITIKGTKYIISNNHIIANSNDCELGDQTWQPGRSDGGMSNHTIGHLYRWVPIRFEDDGSECPLAKFYAKAGNLLARLLRSHSRVWTKSTELNKVDCAVSRPIDPNDLLDEILGIGIPTGLAEAVRGEMIRKSGRTTEVLEGTVLDTEGQARVSFGSHGTALFGDQVITTKIAEGGDSGSLTFNEGKRINGILFAANNEFTIVNKIHNALNLLGLTP